MGAHTAEYVALKEERDHWAETAKMWADEATNRTRWIGVAAELARAIREHDALDECSGCLEALALFDEERDRLLHGNPGLDTPVPGEHNDGYDAGSVPD